MSLEFTRIIKIIFYLVGIIVMRHLFAVVIIYEHLGTQSTETINSNIKVLKNVIITFFLYKYVLSMYSFFSRIL